VNVGDLVRAAARFDDTPAWTGVVVAPGLFGNCSYVIVYWNDKYPDEAEDKCDLEVISESR